jgi:hypothetical protein
LTLARTLGDWKQEVDLLWQLAIRRAEVGQRDATLEYGQAAVRLLERLGKPQARVYREHLDRFSRGDKADASMKPAAIAVSLGTMVTTVEAGRSSAGSGAPQVSVNPSYLRMAISAAKALTHFVGSGMKTVSTETFSQRLKQCGACQHHTGLRCRVCGCFTNVKARLPHEQCPISQWPAIAVKESSRPG